MMLADPDKFGGADHFAAEVEQLAQFVRECKRAEGVEEIMLPGDPERKTIAAKTANGVDFDDENWHQLVELAEKLGVATPTAKAG